MKNNLGEQERSMKQWNIIQPEELDGNVFRKIGKEWMLVTAGPLSSWNTMTAAWGGFGFLWQKNVVFAFVRPGRYTYEFMEKCSTFTLSFFPESFREVLDFCGTHSGRDTDKARETGLVPFDAGHQAVGFDQAESILVCRKVYHQDIIPDHFLDNSIHTHYPKKDYHRMYIGELITCMKEKH